MEIWLDAHISPALAKWIEAEFSTPCIHVRDLNLRESSDESIFHAARKKDDVIVMTKDEDFCRLLIRFKAPPKIIWLTCGNSSNREMQAILIQKLPIALKVLKENELVEIAR